MTLFSFINKWTVTGERGQANILKLLGDLHRFREEFDEAERSYRVALDLYRVVPDSGGEGKNRRGLGKLYIQMARFEAAIRSLEQALQRDEKLGASNAIERDKELLEQLRSTLVQ